MAITKTAAQVFQDNTQPDLGEVRTWGTEVEGELGALGLADIADIASQAQAAAASAALAQASAEATGPAVAYDTKAAADAALGGLSENQIVHVLVDETQDGQRAIYRVETAALVLKTVLYNTIQMEDFADLKANLPSDRVTTGTKIVTKKEGFRYTGAGSGATDHHLTTDTGVKLYSERVNGAYLAAALGFAESATSAANAAAVQAAVNAASNTGAMMVLLPSGHFNIDNVLFHYDALLNPGFNQDAQAQGRITLRGAGRGEWGAYLLSQLRGTRLWSTSSNGEAVLHAKNGRTVKIENLSTVVTNSTLAIKLDYCSQYSGISDIFIAQLGSGGGAVIKDCWNSETYRVFGEGAGKGVSLGVGLHIYNDQIASGFYVIDTVNINGFKESVYFGHKVPGSAKRIHGIQARNVQGGEAEVGVTIGAGVASSHFDLHCEESDLGFKIIDGPRQLSGTITCAANLKDGEFGSLTASENSYSNMDFQLECQSQVAVQVEVFTGVNTDSLTLRQPRFEGTAGLTLALKVQDATHHNFKVIAPRFFNVLTEIDFPERISYLERENDYQWRTSGTGGALTAPPYRFRQDSTNAAQSVMEIYQRDSDQPFLTLGTAITAADNANHVSTTNAGAVVGPGATNWSHYAMAKIQVVEAGVPKDVWFPLFTRL